MDLNARPGVAASSRTVALGRARDPQFRREWAAAVSKGLLPEDSLRTGEFAFAEPLDDGSTLLVVDRFARCSLCYTTARGVLEVSDRADHLGALELDPQALYEYLFFHSIPSPRTVFHGVHRLPAGHLAVVRGRQVEVRPYASLVFRPDPSPSFKALKDEFRQLLTDGVAAELEPGVPACFLSGGTDSSTVAGLIKAGAGSVHTYSIGFDADGYDEMAYARIAAQHFGARHHEYYVTPDDVVDSIGLVAGAYDQPFGNSSALPAYCCAMRAREDGVAKLLAGDGGDELFGGNARYATQRIYAIWQSVPAVLRNGLVKPILALPGADRVTLLRRGRNYVRDAELGLPDRIQHYNLLLRLGLERVLDRNFLASVQPDGVFVQQRQVWALAQADSELDLQLAYDWRYTLAESDLPKVRGTSELAGIKVGYPMLHDALVDFSMRLPVQYKLKGSKLRWFFKEALRDFLPPAIITKPKKGFGLPFGVWAIQHDALRALATDCLRSVGTRGLIQPDFVKSLLEQHLPSHPGYFGEMVWILMTLELWMRQHAPDWRFGDGCA